MKSVKSYPSRELRRVRVAWLKRNRVLVAGAAAFFLVSGAVATWWGLAFANAFGWYCIGILHAGVIATLLHFLNSAVLAHDPRAIFQLRGAWGEDNTRSELESARKKKLVWGWIDSISLQAGDLDHVVITRRGGVVVLDSKFRTDVTADGIADMARSAVRARSRAEALARTLLKPDSSGQRRATRRSVTVTPGIVLWGPARLGVPEDHQVDGVHFIDGKRLKDWLARLPPSPVSQDAADDFLDRMEEFRASTAQVRA